MDLNHLHLHVRDQAASRAYYERWFGFREKVRHGEILFLTNDDGFDLALAPSAEPHNLPAWFHFGFRQESGAAVKKLHDAMKTAGETLLKSLEEYPDYITFRAADPDGYGIEIYWE